MADIKNKNELKRRIDLFMDELDYSINEEFCKETMLMMREFIGRASHLLDCSDAKIKKAKRTARAKTIEEFVEKLYSSTEEYEVRNAFGDIVDRVDAIEINEVIQIAEQMKEGGKNE